MFKEGQRYKFYKIGALGLKERKWVNAVVEHIPSHGRFVGLRNVKKPEVAVVEHIPSHGRFVRFRMHFTNMFGEHSSYVESFTMNELAHMAKSGELVKR